MNSDRENQSHSRREFLTRVGAVSAFLGLPIFAASCEQQKEASEERRFDGKLRLPSGQRVASLEPADEPIVVDVRDFERDRNPPGQEEKLYALRDMGGSRPKDTSRRAFSLKVHGEVESPLKLSFLDLGEFQQVTQTCDVHCVTRWSMFDTEWKGVRLNEIAEKAGVSKKARHVIFEAAHGYTANIELEEAMKDNVLIAYEFAGSALAPAHGAPVRSLVPDLYFWKSAKWLTGIKFVERDEPGTWESGIYHNHADPWKEERFNSTYR